MPRTLSGTITAGIDSLTARQGGFVRMDQLVAMDIPKSTLSRLTRTGGPLTRVLPATYFTGSGALDVEQRETAALLYAGSPSTLTGSAALRHYGMRYLPEDPRVDPIHVLIEHPRSRASRGFVRIERTWRLPDPVLLHGRPLAPLPRALFDAARHTQDQRSTRAILLESLQGGRLTAGQLEMELRAGQRRWTALMRDVLAEYRLGSASAPEAELRQAWESRDLPTLLWNPTLYAADGTRIARVDGYDTETCMAVEMESREYHSGLRWADGQARLRRIASYGVVVVPVVPEHLRADEERVVRELLSAREGLLGRPLPDITAIPFHAL